MAEIVASFSAYGVPVQIKTKRIPYGVVANVLNSTSKASSNSSSVLVAVSITPGALPQNLSM